MDFLSTTPGILLVGAGIIGYSLWNNKRIRANKTWENKAQDSSTTLEKRNQDIIQKHLTGLVLKDTDFQTALLETSVSRCLEEIAEKEQDPLMETSKVGVIVYSSDGVSPQWITLKDSLMQQFGAHIQTINDEARSIFEKDVKEKLAALKEKYAALITQFFDVADKTISLKDAYGDENLTPLKDEVDTVIYKIINKEGRETAGSKMFLIDGTLTSVPDQYEVLRAYLIDTFKANH